ncbi:hypothetical protein KBTX_01869 [wastewater metagenome]|uniref:MmgE/PrpD family n=4 Tax=root TaxID=1 RepID=A0A5B8R9Z4_9ZZZZ|nr:hypothetical protein KBTEX_01869 [uncultured organism]
MSTDDIAGWALGLRPGDLPQAALAEARRCLLDTLGVAAGATCTRLGGIVAAFAHAQMPGAVPLLFSPGTASAVGAALHGAALTDALDAHDGQVLTKGHVGAALVPGLLALPDAAAVDDGELLTRIAAGYEIATRAGIALHATAPDYHTSGAWNALGVAAVAARALGLDTAATAHALGTAEFYGPRSQMMRCIDHPTMVKDGSAFGAMAGVSAAFLAREGFTGAPAATLDDPAVSEIWDDLGQRWRIGEQYRKAYPVCRWAQPAVEAVRSIAGEIPGDPAAIRRIVVETFHEAGRLAVAAPATTEEAQYSLPWSVACALGGGIGAADVADAALDDPARRALAARVAVTEREDLNARFPRERWAAVRIECTDGRVIASVPCEARGDWERPLGDDELDAKFHRLAAPVLGAARANALAEAVHGLSPGRHGGAAAVRALTEAP